MKVCWDVTLTEVNLTLTEANVRLTEANLTQTRACPSAADITS